VHLSTGAGRPLAAVCRRSGPPGARAGRRAGGTAAALRGRTRQWLPASSTVRGGVCDAQARDRRQRRKTPAGPAR